VAQTAAAVLSTFLVVWSLVPLYNMVRVALQEKEEVFSSNVIPVTPSLHSFWTVFQESYWLLAKFWGQMSNSFWIGIAVASLTLVIGTLTRAPRTIRVSVVSSAGRSWGRDELRAARAL